MSTTLAQRLRILRGDVPQAEFAARVGIHKSSWGRYERGVGEPSGSDLARLCAVCGVEPLWLLCGEGNMRATQGVPPAKAAPNGSAAPPEDGTAALPPVTLLGRSVAPRFPFPVERAATAAGRQPPVAATAGKLPAASEGDGSAACRQCRWLEARLEQSDRERRELLQENRQLWRENSDLRERLARLEARSHGKEFAGVAGEAG